MPDQVKKISAICPTDRAIVSYLAEIIKKNLRAALVESGLNQKELAEKAGIDETQLGRYISGRHLPRLDQVEKIAIALSTTPSCLLAERNESAESIDQSWILRRPEEAISAQEKLSAAASLLDDKQAAYILELIRPWVEARSKLGKTGTGSDK